MALSLGFLENFKVMKRLKKSRWNNLEDMTCMDLWITHNLTTEILMNELAPHRLPQPEGNMNRWLMEDEEELERNEVDSDLESTASSKPKHVELEDTCESGSRPNPNLAEDVPDYPFNSKLRYA
ncbi:hypothetical protein Tco_0273548 [Tanacetum coccineum]